MKQKLAEFLKTQLPVAVVFAAFGLAALALFVALAEPREREHRAPFRRDYDETPLRTALAGNGLEQTLTALAHLGDAGDGHSLGRFTGSPGFYAAERYIRQAFAEAGLDVQTQEFGVVVPVTEYCEILDENNQPLPDVLLYPFEPSGLTPLALPEEGLRGKLVLMENTSLEYLNGCQPDECIALTTLDSGTDWKPLASAGVRALIVMEDEAAAKLRSSPDQRGPWEAMLSSFEVGYPRFLARGPLANYAGKRLTLRCKVTWQERKVRNIIGCLRGAATNTEAFICSAAYDSYSVVPELAPGAEQAVSVAALIELARALAPYRGTLRRDVFFAATAGHAQALSGVSRLIEGIEKISAGTADENWLTERRGAEARNQALARQSLEWLDRLEIGARADAEDFKTRWLREAPDWRAYLEGRFNAITGEINLEHKEQMLAARLVYLRAGSPVFREGFNPLTAGDAERKAPENSHPLLRAFLRTQELNNRSGNLLTAPVWQLAGRAEFETWRYRDRLRHDLERIAAYHANQLREIDAALGVRRLFAPYRRTLTLHLELNSGGFYQYKDLAIVAGLPRIGSRAMPQVADLATAIQDGVPETDGRVDFEVVCWRNQDVRGSKQRPYDYERSTALLESEVWISAGYLAFTLMNYRFWPPKVGTPEDTAEGLNPAALRAHLPIIGCAALAVAQGRVAFKEIGPNRRAMATTLHGRVVGNAGVGTVVPNHPMAERTFVRPYVKVMGDNQKIALNERGIGNSPVLPVNPYGEYFCKLNFTLSSHWNWPARITVDAARFGAGGRIQYFKDASRGAQAIFPNEAFPDPELYAGNGKSAKPVFVSLFRCARTELYELGNPKTMKSFIRVDILRKQGLSAPGSLRADPYTVFLEPDQLFYLGLLDGAPENPEVQIYRAFMLNAEPQAPFAPEEPDIFGGGYLAADAAVFVFPHLDAAESMLRTNEKRLRLQQRYGMADALMLDFHQRGREWLQAARDKRAAGDPLGAVLAGDRSLAYAINNHPVIRQRVAHAVVGILWYLALLVPFVFFFEKLICGFADIRKQLVANGIIFLTVFLLLRAFHPAFQMVRSSIMILIGFVMLLITFLVTLMVGGKFQQNIKRLRRSEGRIEGADINRGGVVGTAFMLGLNNMRRRKVRTGLTAATLVLLTFVMICFTSVSSDLVNQEYALGRSFWNGLQIQNPDFLQFSKAEINGIRQIYGRQYPVMTRSWRVAVLDAGSLQNADIVIDRDYKAAGRHLQKRARVNAAVKLDWNEPQFSGLDRFLLTERRWFPRPPPTRSARLAAAEQGLKDKRCIILPDTVARELDVAPADVNAGGVTVVIRSDGYEVIGIIDSVALADYIDLDGRSLLPYDLNAVQTLGRNAKGQAIVPRDVKRLSGAQVILVNQNLSPKGGEQDIVISCGVRFPSAPYRLLPEGPEQPAVGFREQRRLVLDYLERVGSGASYAIDGIAYYGSRQRARTFEGLLELLIPILLAALTVFNTMRGSVFERKDEIYVYNAVGIAPNHVFFMFMAEACVYGVVGAMLGYLLSQAAGRLLSALHCTGGLNMDYSSLETIYASWTIIGAVLLSTLIPARAAARLASPAETVGWAVPRVEGDAMRFDLPFTFTPHDRVAVVSYFQRWLDAHGAGSVGPFFCAAPEVRLRAEPAETRSGGVAPGVASVVWLKPYDLGVSQRLDIWLPTDPETGEYIARVKLTRLSGTVAAWTRTVKPFLGLLRKQFLNWRAAGTAERAEMYAEARRLLQQTPVKEEAHG